MGLSRNTGTFKMLFIFFSLFFVVVTLLKALPGFSTSRDRGGGWKKEQGREAKGGFTYKSRRLHGSGCPTLFLKLDF